MVLFVFRMDIVSFFCAARARSRCSSINISKPANIYGNPTLTGHQLGQIERKSLFVVQPKSEFTEVILSPPRAASSSKSAIPLSSVRLKASSSLRIVSVIVCCFARNSGKTSAHRSCNDIDELKEERFMKAESTTITTARRRMRRKHITASIV